MLLHDTSQRHRLEVVLRELFTADIQCIKSVGAVSKMLEHTVGDIALGEERNNGLYDSQHYLECCGGVLDPFFAVGCHIALRILMMQKLKCRLYRTKYIYFGNP